MRFGTVTISIFLLFLIIPVFGSDTGAHKKSEKSDEIFNHTNLDEEQKSLSEFVNHLAERQGKYHNEEGFIRYVFYRTHNKYLKHYVEQPTIDDLFNRGYYDCLTGTALYLMIFEQLGYNYEVVEFDYHVYLKLNSGKKTYSVESTDPMNGISVSNMKLEPNSNQEGSYYRYTHHMNNSIDVEELIGLLYFNQAVKAYNEFTFDDAYDILQIAKWHYPSTRMDEFEVLIMRALHHKEIALMQ